MQGVMPEWTPEKKETWTTKYKEKLVRGKADAEAYVKDLRRRKYEIGKKQEISAKMVELSYSGFYLNREDTERSS